MSTTFDIQVSRSCDDKRVQPCGRRSIAYMRSKKRSIRTTQAELMSTKALRLKLRLSDRPFETIAPPNVGRSLRRNLMANI